MIIDRLDLFERSNIKFHINLTWVALEFQHSRYARTTFEHGKTVWSRDMIRNEENKHAKLIWKRKEQYNENLIHT